MKNAEIIVVAGLGRCGSSLVLQMLCAAGIPCAGNFPDFEPDEMMYSPTEDFIDSCKGGAVKLLNPHQVILPSGYAYRFIRLTRSKRQQAISTVKVMSMTGMIPEGRGISDVGFERMRQSLKEDHEESLKQIRKHECPVIGVRFEDLIDRPLEAVPRIAEFLDLTPEQLLAMEAAIRPRPNGSRCYPGLMEIEILKEMEERD